jgi:hypothetical protein
MILSNISFGETRSLLRQYAFTEDRSIAIWSSEAIVSMKYKPEDILLLPNKVTVESYEEADQYFKKAVMEELVTYQANFSLLITLDNEERKLYLPPVVEMFGEDAVLTFGYEAFFRAVAERPRKNTEISVIRVKRTVLRQVKNKYLEKPYVNTVQKYLKLEDWTEREDGMNKIFVFGDA